MRTTAETKVFAGSLFWYWYRKLHYRHHMKPRKKPQ